MAKKPGKVSEKQVEKLKKEVDQAWLARVEAAAAKDKEYEDLIATVKEHQAAIEGFRKSFENFDTKLRTLIERNRLR
jgi:ribosomal protein L20